MREGFNDSAGTYVEDLNREVALWTGQGYPLASGMDGDRRRLCPLDEPPNFSARRQVKKMNRAIALAHN